MKIQSIPLDRQGNLLFLKNFQQTEGKFFIEYRVMINDIPFQRVEIYLVDNNQNFIIAGDDGTALYRFPVPFALNTVEDE